MCPMAPSGQRVQPGLHAMGGAEEPGEETPKDVGLAGGVALGGGLWQIEPGWTTVCSKKKRSKAKAPGKCLGQLCALSSEHEPEKPNQTKAQRQQPKSWAPPRLTHTGLMDGPTAKAQDGGPAFHVRNNMAAAVTTHDDEGWTLIRATMDSGAIDNVLPSSLVPEVPTKPNKLSQNGHYFRAANGGRITVEGEKDIVGQSNEGAKLSMTFQACPKVTTPLLSVRRICQAGNRVHFRDDGGTIENPRSGQVIQFGISNGVYYMDIWVHVGHKNQPFHRQAS